MRRLYRPLVIAFAWLALSACTQMLNRYADGVQAERQATLQQASQQDAPPDTPGMYLALIERMQTQGLFFASLAHIDAYEQLYGKTPDTILLRADALRQTGQQDASAQAYGTLLDTRLAARGHRGLGLLAGQAGSFAEAAKQLGLASQLEPTDALTLSDLGYARLRMADIAGARLPLMEAAELAPTNPKILSNVALYLMVSGHAAQAQDLSAQQAFSPDVQRAIHRDAEQITAINAIAVARKPAPAIGVKAYDADGDMAQASTASSAQLGGLLGLQPHLTAQ